MGAEKPQRFPADVVDLLTKKDTCAPYVPLESGRKFSYNYYDYRMAVWRAFFVSG